MIAAAETDQSCFRSRIESAKANLKKMFAVDVCQQMDVLFAEMLRDLESHFAFSSSSSGGRHISGSSQEPTSYSEDSGAHVVATTNSSSSASQEREDVLPSSSAEATISAEQLVLSDLPPVVQLPNGGLALANGDVDNNNNSNCIQAAEKEEKTEKSESIVIKSSFPPLSHKDQEDIKNYEIPKEEQPDHEDSDVIVERSDYENSDVFKEVHSDLENIVDLKKQHQDEESTEPVNGESVLNQTQINDNKPQQFKVLQVETDKVICPIAWCNHISYKRHKFIQHFENAHPEVTSLNCVICGTSMCRPWDMYMHELLYHLTGIFGCTSPECSFVGKTRASVLAHYDVVHLERTPRRPRSLPTASSLVLYRPRVTLYNGDEEVVSVNSNKALVTFAPKKPLPGMTWRKQPKPLINPMKVDQWRSKPDGLFRERPTASSYVAATSSHNYNNQNSGRYEYRSSFASVSLLPPTPFNDNTTYYRYPDQQQLTNGDNVGGFQQPVQHQLQMYSQQNQTMPSNLPPMNAAFAATQSQPPHHNFLI